MTYTYTYSSYASAFFGSSYTTVPLSAVSEMRTEGGFVELTEGER